MSHPCLKISEDLLLWEWNSNSSLLGWPKSSLGFFHKRLWKNPNELFCQSNRSRENGRFTGDKCWWVLTECEGRHQENSQIRRLRMMLLDHSESVSWMIKYVDVRASKEKRNPNSFILIHRTQLEWPPQLFPARFLPLLTFLFSLGSRRENNITESFCWTPLPHKAQFCSVLSCHPTCPGPPAGRMSTYKKCKTWESRVKFYLGQNEDCSPGDSSSDSSEKLFQRGWGWKVSIYAISVKQEYLQSSTYFSRKFLLVMSSRRHHEGF